MTFLIIAGAFDLSVAGMLGACGIALALLSPHLGGLLAALVVVALGMGLGFLNGLVVTRMRIPAFIATLGMMNVYLGLAFIATRGQVLPIDSELLMDMGASRPLSWWDSAPEWLASSSPASCPLPMPSWRPGTS